MVVAIPQPGSIPAATQGLYCQVGRDRVQSLWAGFQLAVASFEQD